MLKHQLLIKKLFRQSRAPYLGRPCRHVAMAICFFQWNQWEVMLGVSTGNWKHCKMHEFLLSCLVPEARRDYGHFFFYLVTFSHAVHRARPRTQPNRGRGGPELGRPVSEIIPGVCDIPSSGRIFCQVRVGGSCFNLVMV